MRLDHRRKRAGLGESGEVAEVHRACREKDGEKRDQQCRRTGHGVNEKLRGRGTAPRTAPQLDEKEGGDQAQLPKQKPVEKIKRGECAEKSRLEHENQAVKEPRHVMNAMRRVNGHQRNDGRKHEHQRSQPVDANVIFDTERRHPGRAFNQSNRTVGRQLRPDKKRDGQRGQPGEQSYAARLLAGEKRDSGAGQRQHGEQREDGNSVHGLTLQSKIATSATTPAARMRR